MTGEGKKAPAFTLSGTDEKGTEKNFALKDFLGKTIVLYFYPRDSTPGCTTEACDFRDNMARIKKSGVVVLGVSPDSVASHAKFRDSLGLNFPLLSDHDKKTADDYGAYGEKKLYDKVSKGIIRSTFLIGPDGKIRKLWRGVKVKGHVEEVLETLKTL